MNAARKHYKKSGIESVKSHFRDDKIAANEQILQFNVM